MSIDTTPRRRLREHESPLRGDARFIALLATAERLLDEGRFDDASITEIARAADISRPTFYFYFASKQALLNSLLSRTLEDLTAGLRKRLEDPDVTPTEAIRTSLEAMADLWFDHRPALMAAVAIGATEPAIFDQMALANHTITDVAARHLVAGRNVSTQSEARELGRTLGWMSERSFYVLVREQPSRKELRSLLIVCS